MSEQYRDWYDKQVENFQEQLELNLNTYQCAEVARYMYEEYLKEMKKTQFSIPSFTAWLNILISNKK